MSSPPYAWADLDRALEDGEVTNEHLQAALRLLAQDLQSIREESSGLLDGLEQRIERLEAGR